MKRKEYKIKLELYTAVENVLNEKQDIIDTVKNLYLSIKDIPMEELRDTFIEKLAEIIHAENYKEDELSDK
jgi:hypothetical protein